MGELGPVQAIECATYTHARRHPMVLGRIGGWSPPFQLTIAQIVVLVVTLGGMLAMWELWARGPGSINLLLLTSVPAASTWAIRHLRIEGRDPLRWFVGVATWASTPSAGVRHGRPDRAPRPTRLCRSRLFVTRTGG